MLPAFVSGIIKAKALKAADPELVTKLYWSTVV
jgi:hypothetical protein